MRLHKAETGEMYSDNSGWEKRVMIDTQSHTLEIDIQGCHLSADDSFVNWLIDALTKVRDATSA